jgi:uncharacterized membrane-anchored protein
MRSPDQVNTRNSGNVTGVAPHGVAAFAGKFISRLSREPVAAKVPEITALFWLIKLLTTAGGEATSDFLGNYNVVIGAAVEFGVFAVALWWQFRTRRYFAPAYWSLAFAIAILGTGVSDTLHLVFGIPYAGTTALWAIVLGVVFWRWNRSEGTLSIHSVTTRRREGYYWATVFATFALGTAVGDFSATALNLGYLASGITFGVVILVPLVAWRHGLNSVLAFWFAYVLTRPLGASFADYVSKPRDISGIDFGDGATAGVAIIAVAALVAYLTLARNDIQASRAPLALERVGRAALEREGPAAAPEAVPALEPNA